MHDKIVVRAVSLKSVCGNSYYPGERLYAISSPGNDPSVISSWISIVLL